MSLLFLCSYSHLRAISFSVVLTVVIEFSLYDLYYSYVSNDIYFSQKQLPENIARPLCDN